MLFLAVKTRVASGVTKVGVTR